MTITALITGRLIADPERRTSASGKDFATARLAAGTDDDSVLCSVIAFGHIGEQLAALAKGDSLALVGRTKPKAWVDREGQPARRPGRRRRPAADGLPRAQEAAGNGAADDRGPDA
jgi:single-stranded DNA-binding protein